MKRLFFATLVAMLSVMGVSAETKSVVWLNPTTEYCTSYGDGFFHLAMDVTKVEMNEKETVVYLRMSQRSDYPDYWFQFAKGTTVLIADGKKYAVESADGFNFDSKTQTGKDGTLDIAMHFKPLPLNTKVFDLSEGDFNGAFKILGIKSIEERYKQFFPSYWRNEVTGNWDIAFFDDFVVYDCKFWDYKVAPNRKQNIGSATFTICNGADELQIKVGKDKNGKRTIQIGKDKGNYSMMTSRFMPDYPTKDTRTGFVDTNYKTDTVTFIGWIKDMPENYKKINTFEMNSNDFLMEEQLGSVGHMDSLGRFEVKIPVENSSEFFCDWRRCFVRTMLEPGKTYFMLYDFKEGRRYFMGDDVRLQNELMKYPLDWDRVNRDKAKEGDDKYLASVDSLLNAKYKYIDDLCAANPSLSTRFNIYSKGNTFCQQAEEFGQSRFRYPEYKLSDRAAKYAYDTFWTKMEKPYTLHRDIRTFIRDYTQDAGKRISGPLVFVWTDHIEEYTSNEEEELATMRKWANFIETAKAKIDAETDSVKKVKLAEKMNKENAELIKRAEEIMNGAKAQNVMQSYFFSKECQTMRQALDSLKADDFLCDVLLAKQFLNHLDQKRTSLSKDNLDSLKMWVKNPAMIERVMEANNVYLALEKKTIDKSTLKSNEGVKNMTKGEEILKKILEPYKGKLVLMDIWGTWCGPCKEALSHSQEEYERLKPYDMVFLYLANRSPEKSWNNIIKEYNVSGENVVHYNLPIDQQSAIEQYLQVHAFPTYKLIDKEGNILNVNADPRDLNNFEKLIKTVSGI